MAPQIPILAQSENKSKFLERLGISDHSDEGKRLYAMMKVRVTQCAPLSQKLIELQEEAIAGRARMSASPQSLIPRLINDPNVKPPYSNTQISEAAMHRETIYIYRTARSETRAIYDRGHYIEGGAEENWIIKWLLWHVFRYRDNRNRGRAGAGSVWIERPSRSPESLQGMTPSDTGFSGRQLSPASLGGGYSPGSDKSAGYPSSLSPGTNWRQPAHSTFGFQPLITRAGGLKLFLAIAAPECQQSSSRGYYDPVRDAQRTNR